jgi:hypothetical protein
MGGYRNTDQTITFDTDYIGAWYEEQNAMTRLHLRELLDENRAVFIDFQPGDGTRYEFHLWCPNDMTVVGTDRPPREQFHDSDVLYATLSQSGHGVGTFNRLASDGDRDYIMSSIRHRIEEKMTVPNPCTVEALAATIYSLWYMDD